MSKDIETIEEVLDRYHGFKPVGDGLERSVPKELRITRDQALQSIQEIIEKVIGTGDFVSGYASKDYVQGVERTLTKQRQALTNVLYGEEGGKK